MGAGRRWDGTLPRHLKGPAIGANSVVASARRMCQGSIEILGEPNRKQVALLAMTDHARSPSSADEREISPASRAASAARSTGTQFDRNAIG